MKGIPRYNLGATGKDQPTLIPDEAGRMVEFSDVELRVMELQKALAIVGNEKMAAINAATQSRSVIAGLLAAARTAEMMQKDLVRYLDKLPEFVVRRGDEFGTCLFCGSSEWSSKPTHHESNCFFYSKKMAELAEQHSLEGYHPHIKKVTTVLEVCDGCAGLHEYEDTHFECIHPIYVSDPRSLGVVCEGLVPKPSWCPVKGA